MLQLLRWIGGLVLGALSALRWFLVALLAIGLPAFIYLTFFADEPVFAPENDVQLGLQTVRAIAESSDEYPLLPEKEYPEVYAHLRGLVARLLESPDILYRDLFAYNEVRIIHDDDVLNAFCAPGGYIYVFTGLMRYLDHEDHLAGVLGHEIAHAELRHSSLRMQREYGAKRLFEFVVLSNPLTAGNVINATIVKDLMSLSYSRDQEAQADDYSVRYLSTSGYACNGTAGFFAKLLTHGQAPGVPEFLSDHPDSQARVDAILRTSTELGCDTELGDPSEWQAIQASLPPLAVEDEEDVEASDATPSQ